MKLNLKYIITPILLLVAGIAAARVGVSVEAGPQLSNKIAGRAGASVEVSLNGALSFDPGLYYSLRHRTAQSRIETTSSSGEVLSTALGELNSFAHYIQLPLRLSFNLPTGGNDLQKVMIGPYLAWCLGGKTSVKASNNGIVTAEFTSPTVPTVIDNRFDVGATIEYRYILHSHIEFGIHAELGFLKRYNSIIVEENEDLAFYHHLTPGPAMNLGFGVCVGYRF